MAKGKKKVNKTPLCPISLNECDNPAGQSFKNCYYCGRFDAEEDRLLALNQMAAITKATKAPDEKNHVNFSEGIRHE